MGNKESFPDEEDANNKCICTKLEPSRHFQASEDASQLKIIEERNLEDLPKGVLYYGWFINRAESLYLKNVVAECFEQCLSVPQCKRFIQTLQSQVGAKTISELYRKPGKDKEGSNNFRYHVTAKFLGREVNEEYQKMVAPFVGAKFRLCLSALFFTAQTCGLRVTLTEGQREIFDERDEKPLPLADSFKCLSIDKPTKSSYEPPKSNLSQETIELGTCDISQEKSTSNDTETVTEKKSEIFTEIRKTLEKELNENEMYSFKSLKNSKCKCKWHREIEDNQLQLAIHLNSSSLTTSKINNSRAHVTFGCLPNVKAVQTGLDLLDLNDLERRIFTKNVPHKDYKIPWGILREFGRPSNAFILYPSHEILVEATFNFFR